MTTKKVTTQCHYSCASCKLDSGDGNQGDQCLDCLVEPLDLNKEKWSGRTFDPLTEQCTCLNGFVDIGSKDCYNEEYGKEAFVRPLDCAKS